MRLLHLLGLPLFAFSVIAPARAECIPFTDAREHIGETRCIAGKVIRVEQGSGGVHYLDFCDDYQSCPFTVVIFAGDLRYVGDVRQLTGHAVEIHGDIKEYDSRAEIILHDASQFSGAAARIPPLPKDYDVEKAGHYSAGMLRRAKPPRATTKKRQTAKLPIDVPEDSEP
jgi:hypothetical protein